MKRGATEHPKMMMLAGKLGIPKWGAIGIMESLWHFTGRYAPAGDIGKYTDEMIAAGIGYTEDANELIQALLACRWLDKSGQVRLMVHDWSSSGDDYADKWLARNGLLYADGKEPRSKLKNNPDKSRKNKTCPEKSRQVRKSTASRARGIESESESESESYPPVVPRGDESAADRILSLSELRGLTMEQWVQAWRCHPVKVTPELEAWLSREAVLAAPIDKPALWLRARFSRWELDQGQKKTNNAAGVGGTPEDRLEAARQAAAVEKWELENGAGRDVCVMSEGGVK